MENYPEIFRPPADCFVLRIHEAAEKEQRLEMHEENYVK